MDDKLIIDDNERIRIDAINKVNHIQSLDLKKQILLRIESDPKVRENYEIFKTQCQIDELLNKVVIFIKSKNISNEQYTINENKKFQEFVLENDFIKFAMFNIIPIINTEVIDENDIELVEEKEKRRIEIAKTLYSYTIDELRNFLFYCFSIKPLPIPKIDYRIDIDVKKCYAAGVNPGALNSDNWFMEEKDYNYIFNNDLREIIIDGKVLGEPIATKEQIEDNKKKNTNFR